MSAKRRLVPEAEIRATLDLLREYGIQFGAVDIRADGVTVYPPANNPGSAYDRYKAKKDQNSERSAHSS